MPQTSKPVQAKAVYQRWGRLRPSFWRGLEAAVDFEPLPQTTMRPLQGSRSLRDDFEALRGDRDQELSKVLNA
jgi:hypothetical protein